MMKKPALVTCLMMFAAATAAGADTNARQDITLDEDVWVLFYDLPSRRFRNIRDAFVRRNWPLAQHYLVLSESAKVSGDSRNAGNYLWATAHHLERCVLWSDARLTRR